MRGHGGAQTAAEAISIIRILGVLFVCAWSLLFGVCVARVGVWRRVACIQSYGDAHVRGCRHVGAPHFQLALSDFDLGQLRQQGSSRARRRARTCAGNAPTRSDSRRCTANAAPLAVAVLIQQVARS